MKMLEEKHDTALDRIGTILSQRVMFVNPLTQRSSTKFGRLEVRSGPLCTSQYHDIGNRMTPQGPEKAVLPSPESRASQTTVSATY